MRALRVNSGTGPKQKPQRFSKITIAERSGDSESIAVVALAPDTPLTAWQ
jgi:hypothetical protein